MLFYLIDDIQAVGAGHLGITSFATYFFASWVGVLSLKCPLMSASFPLFILYLSYRYPITNRITIGYI